MLNDNQSFLNKWWEFQVFEYRRLHGMFIPYIERELEPHGISQRTAYRYIGLFANNDKIATVANLQDAYRKVEQLESERIGIGQRWPDVRWHEICFRSWTSD